jgi:hypothetical protein
MLFSAHLLLSPIPWLVHQLHHMAIRIIDIHLRGTIASGAGTGNEFNPVLGQCFGCLINAVDTKAEMAGKSDVPTGLDDVFCIARCLSGSVFVNGVNFIAVFAKPLTIKIKGGRSINLIHTQDITVKTACGFQVSHTDAYMV